MATGARVEQLKPWPVCWICSLNGNTGVATRIHMDHICRQRRPDADDASAGDNHSGGGGIVSGAGSASPIDFEVDTGRSRARRNA